MVSSTPVQPPGTLFHPIFMTSLTLVLSENDSRMNFLIVLITDYCWRSWTCRIAAPYKLYVDWLIDNTDTISVHVYSLLTSCSLLWGLPPSSSVHHVWPMKNMFSWQQLHANCTFLIRTSVIQIQLSPVSIPQSTLMHWIAKPDGTTITQSYTVWFAPVCQAYVTDERWWRGVVVTSLV